MLFSALLHRPERSACQAHKHVLHDAVVVDGTQNGWLRSGLLRLLLAQVSVLASHVTFGDLHGDAARRFEGRVHGAGEAGQRQGFGAAALVELLLPDDVSGLAGAALGGGVMACGET